MSCPEVVGSLAGSKVGMDTRAGSKTPADKGARRSRASRGEGTRRQSAGTAGRVRAPRKEVKKREGIGGDSADFAELLMRVKVIHALTPGAHMLEGADLDQIARMLQQVAPFLTREQQHITARGQVEEQVVRAVIRSFVDGAASFTEDDAVRWGGGYKIEVDLGDADAAEFEECGRDIEELCRRKQQRLAAGRLSVARVDECVTDEMVDSAGWPDGRQDRLRLRVVAMGMTVPVAEGFQPNGAPPPLREKYVLVASAVNKGCSAQWRAGTVILLPTHIAVQIPGIHFSSMHFTLKKGTEAGRTLGDSTNVTDGQWPLNSEELHDAIKDLWGEICHPTLEDI